MVRLEGYIYVLRRIAMSARTISVIIPTLNASKYIENLITRLNSQTVKPNEIVVVDSQSDDNTVELCGKYDNVRIIEIIRKDFDHGGTRDMAMKTCGSDFVLFTTQDAVPNNEFYIENLLKSFEDNKVAISSGRQIARDDAWPMEKLVREFNYPAVSHVRSKADLPQYGIKTYFFSDVCAAYRKDIYEELGGFEHPLKTNEDMFYAAKVIENGYKIAYAAEAEVVHSHNFTLKEQYKRNVIIGTEIERHKELLNGVSTDAEGMKLVKYVVPRLLKQGRVLQFIRFGLDCCARKLGYTAGKRKLKKQMKQVV